MARKKKLSPDQQAAYEQEQLNRPINPTGEGEAQAIKALLSPEFENMSNLNATDVALMLQQIIRGQNALISRYDETNIQIARLREHQAKVDERIAALIETERKEVTDVLDRSRKLKATGDKKDKIIAQGARMYTEAVQMARSSKAVDKLRFEEQLRLMPQEQIISPGVWIQTREGMKLIPEEVRIKHKVWLLPPGQMITVPKVVGDVLRDRRKSQVETQKRKELLGKQKEQNVMAQEWNQIEGKAPSMPLA